MLPLQPLLLLHTMLKDFAAIDFETANYEPSSICSMGVVIVRDGVIVDRFYSLIRPKPNQYIWFCQRVHHLSYRDTNKAPRFPKVWEKIGHKLEGLPLVAHNSNFDEKCLKGIFKAYGMKYPNFQFYDTYREAEKTLTDVVENTQLQTVAAYYGFKLENHHNALADAEACAHIALNMF